MQHDKPTGIIRATRGATKSDSHLSTAGGTSDIGRRLSDAWHGDKYTVGVAPPARLRSDPENRAYRDAITGGAFKKNKFI